MGPTEVVAVDERVQQGEQGDAAQRHSARVEPVVGSPALLDIQPHDREDHQSDREVHESR